LRMYSWTRIAPSVYPGRRHFSGASFLNRLPSTTSLQRLGDSHSTSTSPSPCGRTIRPSAAPRSMVSPDRGLLLSVALILPLLEPRPCLLHCRYADDSCLLQNSYGALCPIAAAHRPLPSAISSNPVNRANLEPQSGQSPFG
jgi:hypothetical protein